MPHAGFDLFIKNPPRRDPEDHRDNQRRAQARVDRAVRDGRVTCTQDERGGRTYIMHGTPLCAALSAGMSPNPDDYTPDGWPKQRVGTWLVTE